MNVFNCFLTAPRPTLGHSQRDSLTKPMLITTFELFWPEGHREPRNYVGSLSPTERLVGLKRELSNSYHNALSQYTIIRSTQPSIKKPNFDVFW